MPDNTTITIQLTQGFETVIDLIDADLAERKWCALVHHERPYAGRSLNPGTQYLAVIIMSRVLNRPLQGDELVDHADNNSLNNRRNNLRLADFSLNNQNKKRQ